MAVTAEYEAEWKAWHAQRIESLNGRYGILSVVSQDWLTPGEPFVSPFVPGQWLLEEGEIYYLRPTDVPADSGDALTVDGVPAWGRMHIRHGHNDKIGTGSALPMFYRDLEVETVTRVNSAGEMIYAVRVRDPHEAERRRFADIPTFPLDEKWIVPATYLAKDKVAHDVPTVEPGLYETAFTLGSLIVMIDGTSYDLSVSGHRGGSRAGGYFIDDVRVHFGDLTNGRESYGGGRVVRFSGLDELQTLTAVDFNRAVSLPCALSPFVACATTPPGNKLPMRVTAGEHVPPVPHERVQTYTG